MLFQLAFRLQQLDDTVLAGLDRLLHRRVDAVEIHGAHLNLPYWLELQHLLKVVVVLVKLCPDVLQKQLVEVLEGNVIVALVVGLSVRLKLGKDMEILPRDLRHLRPVP